MPEVGARINYASNLGTVRFVGEVQGAKGLWLGVEWDDPQRGKHSGSKDGKQYFTCVIPHAASFIRQSTLITLGQSFLHALVSKYVELPFEMPIEKVLLGSSKGAIEVEAVGMNKVRDKLSRLERLREISLDMENVAYADASGDIRAKCPNIKGLDLSRSLVPGWDVIAAITAQLPLLETLSLNFNRFQLPSQQFLGESFTHVKDLRLNGTLTTWDDMLSLLPFFPELLHLELGLNHIQRLTVPAPSHGSTRLSSINFEENQLNDWQNIMAAMAFFVKLDRAILSDNLLEGIPPPSSPSVDLPQIKHLALASNSIRVWSDIDALRLWFPELRTLNLNLNPIVRVSSSRPLIIARLSSLTALNASAVSPAERRDSELFYLSFIMKNGPKSDESREHEYPRYRELCEKYGKPDEIQEAKADTLRSRLIGATRPKFQQIQLTVPEVHFYRLPTPVASSTGYELPAPEFTLRILPSMTLQVLRSKVLKTLKASPRTSIQMWLLLERGSVCEFAELELNLSSRAIEWWGVENDCKIAVHVA